MITLKSPINKSLLYSTTVHIEYSVAENSKFTSKVVFILDGVKYEKVELSGIFVVENLDAGKHILRAYLVNKSNKIIVGSEVKSSFETNDDVIIIKNKLSDVLTSQIPSFIREDYDKFVTFIEFYYKSLEQSNDPTKVPFSQAEFKDVDYTPEILVDKFKKLFIPDFPEELAVDSATGKPLNIRTLIKRAKQFYQSKGTEKSFGFLFRVLFDVDIEIFYPRSQMMIVSGGLWIERKTIKILPHDRDKARALVGNVVYQLDANGVKLNRARVSACRIHKQSPYIIAELDLVELYGTFDAGLVYSDLIYQDAEETFVFDIKRGITSINISNGGRNYKIGDIVKIISMIGHAGVGYVGRVSKVDSNGVIENIETVNSGFNYEDTEDLYQIDIISVNGSNATGTGISSGLCAYPGYYKNSNNVLGGKNFLQDNFYYQTHSYEIKANIPISKYEDNVKRIVHPSGYLLFGELVFNPTILTSPTTLQNNSSFVSQFIGNFAAYRMNSSLNIRQDGEDLFPNGFNPLQPNPPQTGSGEFVHDVDNDPIKIRIENAFFSSNKTLPEISDIEEKSNYWVVFSHPNSNINTNETLSSFLDMTIESMAIVDTVTLIGDEF